MNKKIIASVITAAAIAFNSAYGMSPQLEGTPNKIERQNSLRIQPLVEESKRPSLSINKDRTNREEELARYKKENGTYVITKNKIRFYLENPIIKNVEGEEFEQGYFSIKLIAEKTNGWSVSFSDEAKCGGFSKNGEYAVAILANGYAEIYKTSQLEELDTKMITRHYLKLEDKVEGCKVRNIEKTDSGFTLQAEIDGKEIDIDGKLE